MSKNSSKEEYNAYMREYMLRRYHDRRDSAVTKLGGCCSSCGSRENLEIDHIDPAEKDFSLARLWSVRETLFWEEIDKCQLLCNGCHVEKSKKDISEQARTRNKRKRDKRLSALEDQILALHRDGYTIGAIAKKVGVNRSLMISYIRDLGLTPNKKTKDTPHGTESGYTYHKCRCDLCKKAHSERARKYRNEKKK